MLKAKTVDKWFDKIMIILIAFVVVGAIGMTLFILTSEEMKLRSKPEQTAHVEVVEKRIDRSVHYGRGSRAYSGNSTLFIYCISFRFSDGTVKELKVDQFYFFSIHKEAPYSSVYAGMNEGDTGLLTYKELEPTETKNWEDLSKRQFIRFEQDAEYGGETFRWVDRDRTDAIFAIVISLLMLFSSCFCLVLLWIAHRKMRKEKEERKILIREKAEQHAAEQKMRSREEKQKREAQEEQAQKRKREKQRQKRQRKKQRK